MFSLCEFAAVGGVYTAGNVILQRSKLIFFCYCYSFNDSCYVIIIFIISFQICFLVEVIALCKTGERLGGREALEVVMTTIVKNSL